MEEQMFRKNAMDRISSPEELHDYIRVTSPRLWMLLTAILVLLVGFIVYAAAATINDSVPVKLTVESYGDADKDDIRTAVYGELSSSYENMIKPGMKVRLSGEEGVVDSVQDTGDGMITVVCNMEVSYLPLPDGNYDAEIIVESIKPLSFLWN